MRGFFLLSPILKETKCCVAWPVFFYKLHFWPSTSVSAWNRTASWEGLRLHFSKWPCSCPNRSHQLFCCPTALAIKLCPPNLPVALLWKTDFTNFFKAFVLHSSSQYFWITVQLSDGQKYFMGFIIAPKTTVGHSCAMWCSVFKMDVSNMERYVWRSCVKKYITQLLIYCFMLVPIFFHSFDTLQSSHPFPVSWYQDWTY